MRRATKVSAPNGRLWARLCRFIFLQRSVCMKAFSIFLQDLNMGQTHAEVEQGHQESV